MPFIPYHPFPTSHLSRCRETLLALRRGQPLSPACEVGRCHTTGNPPKGNIYWEGTHGTPAISQQNLCWWNFVNLARLIFLLRPFFWVRRFLVGFHGNEASYFLAEWHWGVALRCPESMNELGHDCIVIVLVKRKLDSASWWVNEQQMVIFLLNGERMSNKIGFILGFICVTGIHLDIHVTMLRFVSPQN